MSREGTAARRERDGSGSGAGAADPRAPLTLAAPTLPFQLRPITDADLDVLVTLDRAPEVMRFINGGKPTPRALCAEVRLRRMLAATRPGLGFFTVESPTRAFMG